MSRAEKARGASRDGQLSRWPRGARYRHWPDRSERREAVSVSVQPAARGRNPFDTRGVTRGEDGIARYDNRPESLVHMLRASVDRNPDALAVAEVGGESLSYRELWQRASRVAGGLRAAGVRRGDRAAIVLPNGVDW